MKRTKSSVIIILFFSLILVAYATYTRYDHLKDTMEIQDSILQLVALKSASAEWNIELNKIHNDNFAHYDSLNEAALKYEKEMKLFLKASEKIQRSAPQLAINLVDLSSKKKSSMEGYLSEVAVVRNSLKFLDTSLFLLHSQYQHNVEIIKFLSHAQHRLSILIASNQSIYLKKQQTIDECNNCTLRQNDAISNVNHHLNILKDKILLSHQARSAFYNTEHESVLNELFEHLSSLYVEADMQHQSIQSQVFAFTVILIITVAILLIFLYWLYRTIEGHRVAGTTDPLTGLYNRKKLFDNLKTQIPLHKKSRNKLALLFIDLDNFKNINDAHGHDVGDRLLQLLSKRLTSNVRTKDLIYRIGGDEFIILMRELPTIESAEHIAENLLSICNKPYLIDDINCSATLSIGISISPEHSQEPNELLKYADEAMYKSKSKGKGQVTIWSDK